MLNVDASYDEDNGCGSTSAIIRDSLGAMIAETYALKEGLMLIQHIGGNRLVV
jgi:hypothetical protein